VTGEATTTMPGAARVGGKLPAAYDRFARTFGAPRWDGLSDQVRQAVLAATAQVGHETDGERILSVEQVAERLKVSTDLVYAALKTGALAGTRAGGKLWRIRESAMWDWLEHSVEAMDRRRSSSRKKAVPIHA
jgi:excisionase family DNA binding protein